jgi:hypothetical protein
MVRHRPVASHLSAISPEGMISMRHIFGSNVKVVGLTLFVALASSTCHSRQPVLTQHSAEREARIASARLFTQRYSRSRLSGWHVHASAAGADCAVLFVDVPIVMEDSLIEAMHYGAGAYDVYEGGIHQFSRERSFRGVAYKDVSGRVWTYDAVAESEARSLEPCS